ncbi:MAG: hypothetical protein E7607_05335 [Ruminococcaceae bacterium]|nr:hypothetical protein [Oscillospiraceae bacterium]
MKRLIAIALTVMLLLSVIPFAVFAADDPALDPNNVCYAEDSEGTKTYYTSVKTALNQAPSGSTIVLLRDSSYTGHGTFTSKSLTVDGQGYTLTTSGGYAFDVCGNANNTFTVKNLKVNSARFIYNEFSTVNIENCTVNDSYGLVFSIALPDGTDANINIKDTTINLNTTNNEPFARTGNNISKNCDITFNIQNSDINLTTSKAENGGDSTKSCFNLLTAGTVTVNLDATSSLKMDGQYMKTMFHGHDASGALALNLANGATVAVNNCVAGTGIITANMNSKTTIVDNGAKWVVGVEAAKKGITLPTISENGDEHSWFDGDNIVSNPYVNTSATADVVLTHKAYVAEGGDPFKIVDASGNNVATYSTLQKAVDALTDGQKIIVVDDYVLTSALVFSGTYDKENLKNVVIEGATKADGKVKITCVAGFAEHVGLYNLTVKNLEIANVATSDVFKYDPYTNGAWVSDFASSTTTVDNCTITAPSGAVFRLAAQANGADYQKHEPFIIKVKDSEISSGGSAATSVICVPWNTSASVDLSVENSTITAVGGNATSPNPETSYVFCFNPTKAAVTDISSTCNITIDGTSKLIANFTGTTTPTGGIFRNIGGTVTINLAEGAELYVNNGAEKTQNSFIMNERGNLTVNDDGAVWKIGANTAKAGIKLHDNETGFWLVGGELIEAGKTYTNTNATEDVVASVFDIRDGFSVVQGAGLKISGDSAGIAFGVFVSEEVLDNIGENASVGICILPEPYKDIIANDDALTEGVDYIELGKMVSDITGEGDQSLKFAISDIPVEDSNAVFVRLTAVGFISYANESGENIVIYTENYYTTSLYELAVKSQNKDSELVKSILAVNA